MKAAEVQIATYVYDNSNVHECLVKRLKGRARAPFDAHVYVDKEMYEEQSSSKQQRRRVAELRSNGAKIHVCNKIGGSFHAKGAVVDRRVLFTGSANLTTRSKSNEE